VKDLKEFNIDWVGLAEKSYDYQYVADNSFFALFEHSLVQEGKCNINVVLTKSTTMIICEFDIKGTIVLTCDRSLDTFDYPIETQEQIIFKFSEQAQELSDEIVLIPKDLPTINLAQYIYEFIGLCVPMKKLHPRFLTDQEDEDNLENDVLVYSSASEEDEQEDESEVNPIWEDLKKLIK
jgi:uncharacterized protein